MRHMCRAFNKTVIAAFCAAATCGLGYLSGKFADEANLEESRAGKVVVTDINGFSPDGSYGKTGERYAYKPQETPKSQEDRLVSVLAGAGAFITGFSALGLVGFAGRDLKRAFRTRRYQSQRAAKLVVLPKNDSQPDADAPDASVS